MVKIRAILFLLISLTTNIVSSQIVSTYAGTGNPGAIGDSELAVAANLEHPTDLVTNESGDLFFIDKENKRIRVVHADTKIINILVSSDGTDGIAPVSLTYNENVIYFIDSLNYFSNASYRIMKCAVTGGLAEEFYNFSNSNVYGGIVFSDDKLFVTNKTTNQIIVIKDIYTVPSSYPLLPLFNSLSGIAANVAGDLFVCDATFIRKIELDDNILVESNTIIASGLFIPKGLTVAYDGTVYVSDVGNHKIYKIDDDGLSDFANHIGGSGYVDGQLSTAKFYKPYGITIDGFDNIFIADTYNNRIRRIGCDNVVVPEVELSPYNSEGCGQELYYHITNSELELDLYEDWYWYSNSCGDSLLNVGDTLYFDADSDKVFYLRAEKGCFQPSSCTEIIFKKTYCDFNENVPTAFSPNNDGVNDTWIIKNIEQYPNNNVYIYSRWGDLVVSIKNYDNQQNIWSGKSLINNKEVAAGTYFYTIEAEDKSLTSGWLQVVK